jgi:beta-lactamase class A
MCPLSDNMSKGILQFAGVLLIFLTGLAFGYYLPKDSQSISDTEQKNSYPYLARRIFLDNPNDIIINFVPLRTRLRDYVERQQNPLGVYFQYLPTGGSIGVNQDTAFVGASLLKLPTVMRVYKLINEGKIKKEQQLEIREIHLDKRYGNLWKKGIGAKVTVEEAIKEVLIHSDNTADKLLYTVAGGFPEDVYKHTDIPPTILADQQAVTPRNYSSLLRSLFFSGYVSYESSDEILDYLSQAKDKPLRADIPNNIKISQKIGVYEVDADDTKNEVHSACGIFYVPNKPYILCIMTVTDDETAATETSEISNIVYDFISAK